MGRKMFLKNITEMGTRSCVPVIFGTRARGNTNLLQESGMRQNRNANSVESAKQNLERWSAGTGKGFYIGTRRQN